MLLDDARKLTDVLFTTVRISVRDEHANHRSPRRLIGDGVIRDAVQRRLDASAHAAGRAIVRQRPDERVILRHRQIRELDEGPGAAIVWAPVTHEIRL
jgi:hypothetical protein